MIFINHQYTRVLLATQKKGSGFYMFPGGKTDQYESLVQCAQREVWEELGFSGQRLIKDEVKRSPSAARAATHP